VGNYGRLIAGISEHFRRKLIDDKNTLRVPRQDIYRTPKVLILQGFREDEARIYYQFTTFEI